MKPSPRSDQVRALREAKFGGRRSVPAAAEVRAIADRAEMRSSLARLSMAHRDAVNVDVVGSSSAGSTTLAAEASAVLDTSQISAPKETKMPSLATRSKPKGFDKGLHSKLNMRLVRARAKGDAEAVAAAEKDLRAAFPNAKPHTNGKSKPKARKVAKAKKKAKR